MNCPPCTHDCDESRTCPRIASQLHRPAWDAMREAEKRGFARSWDSEQIERPLEDGGYGLWALILGIALLVGVMSFLAVFPRGM